RGADDPHGGSVIEPGRAAAGREVTELEPGADLRRPEHRRETFLRFYLFHLEHRAHPGAVYLAVPHLREALGWDDEAALWFAFLNGNTQHPATSLILHRRFPGPWHTEAMIDWFGQHWGQLGFDADRIRNKRMLPAAARHYRDVCGGDQAGYWADAAAGGWSTWWHEATAIPGFARLSAWSYADFQRISGIDVEPTTLLLDDRAGSRSHRNGLAKVLGRDDLDWHASNPGFDGRYPSPVLAWLDDEGAALLGDARTRSAGSRWARDVTYLTLESALCTYKSWHRPNRRYPGVYLDMFADRLDETAARWPDEDLGPLRDARDALPAYLRVEARPADPGCVPVKQNWYRTTGHQVALGYRWPEMMSDFDRAVDAGRTPR
ncbi:MAG: hypothetical protein ACRDXE_04910, partial [Acidimicrobiales bacterium]